MFLMYRVELKVLVWIFLLWTGLSVPNVPCGVESIVNVISHITQLVSVPNVPCGVERNIPIYPWKFKISVPNVPCGVERTLARPLALLHAWRFLMYRVELKEDKPSLPAFLPHFVPNVPCGVERLFCWFGSGCARLFLMYRVELKVSSQGLCNFAGHGS